MVEYVWNVKSVFLFANWIDTVMMENDKTVPQLCHIYCGPNLPQ
jgi:hypothetical protein